MTTHTNRLRQLLRTILDAAEPAATIAAGAIAGLATYRTISTNRPTELRATLALAAAALAATTTDNHIADLTAPLRRRFALHRHPHPSIDTLSHDVLATAARDAAIRSLRIAAYNSSLSHPDSWTGHADGTATSKLASGAVLRFQPAHKDLHTSASRGWDERYDLIVDHQQIKIESVAQLHELLKKLAAGQSTNETEADAVDPLGDGDDRTEPLVYEDDDQWADAETGEDPQWDTVEAI